LAGRVFSTSTQSPMWMVSVSMGTPPAPDRNPSQMQDLG
jgi:hypothetical protein